MPNLDDFKPIPVSRFSGVVDYQGPTKVINGCAVLAQNIRYLPDECQTRYGTLTTMTGTADADITGIDVLEVKGNLNPGQVPILFDSAGTLLEESPSGSGTLVPIATPFTLPASARMGTSQGENSAFLAFSDGQNGLCPPLLVSGPTRVISPISQNSIGGIWTPELEYLVGDVVRSSQNPNRWFRCIVPAEAGVAEPTWPTLDGYLLAGVPPLTILSVAWSTFVTHFNQAIAIVASSLGVMVGDSITVAGCSNPFFDGVWTVTAVTSNSITWIISASGSFQSGGGGTITDTTSVLVGSVAAGATDGASQWVEWTPAVPQFLPKPEAPAQVISVKGQAGAPSGSISSAQDVYICFAYQNANGESAWTQPIVFSNTAASDVLEVFFQNNGDNPGPGVPAAYGAAGYGGPRMPNWLISVMGLSDPTISWPNLKCLNVYVAAVAHGAAPPTTYSQYASGAAVYQPVVITSIPASGTQFNPRATPTAALTKIPYIGEGGPRYLAVARLDLNESLVPIDPDSPLLVNLASSIVQSGTANITFIQRSANVVTCTVDQLAGFAQGAQVIIAGVGDSSFDGNFTLTGVSPNQWGGATLIWGQSGSNGASTNGTATSASAASAFVVPQVLIATISRTTNVVTAVVNSLDGIAVGVSINVSGVAGTATSFNGGPFTITAVTPGSGGGGSITWAQTASNDTGGGYTELGIITPTGAGVGTNVAQSITLIARDFLGLAGNGYAAAYFEGASQPNSPPPGFVAGATVTIAGVSDSSFNGTFQIVNAGGGQQSPSTAVNGGWFIVWAQAGSSSHGNFGGTVTLVSGGSPQQGQGNTTAISRSSGVVTATLDSTANFLVGAEVHVNNVTDPSFDGTFVLTTVTSTQLQWNQPGANGSSSGGTVTQTSGGIVQPTPVAVLPPGGPFISADIAAFSVQGGSQAGPFTYIPAQDPVTPFSATIQVIGAVNGAVTALLSDTSGIEAGDTVKISGSTNGWFDGVFVLAEVTGNTVEWAGVGPGTGYSGGTLSLVPTQPTIAIGQNHPLSLSSISRAASGIVSAQLSDVTGITAGQRISVSGVIDGSFDGIFTILSVQQLTSQLGGTVTWQSATLSAGSSSGGTISGLPGIILNSIDAFLATAFDVTKQLSSIPAPKSSDAFFCPTLRMVCYIDNTDYPGSFLFSNVDDPANITGSSGDPSNPGSGIYSVQDGASSLAVCVRELANSEIIALKQNGGYRIQPSGLFPSQWSEQRLWKDFGPVSALAVATGQGPSTGESQGQDFVGFWDQELGPHVYVNSELLWIGKEITTTLKRVNKSALSTIWAAVDEEAYELKFGVPLDGATKPNYEFVCSYLNGWGFPEVLNRYGKLIASRDARRWSINPFAARCAKAVQRTLTSPPDSRLKLRQFLYGLPSTGSTPETVTMIVPDTYSDNGAGIPSQYQPWLTQNGLAIMRFGGYRGQLLGSGTISMTPVTDNPNETFTGSTIYLNGDGVAQHFERGLRMDDEYGSIVFSNDGVAGAWFALKELTMYANIKFAGRRGT